MAVTSPKDYLESGGTNSTFTSTTTKSNTGYDSDSTTTTASGRLAKIGTNDLESLADATASTDTSGSGSGYSSEYSSGYSSGTEEDETWTDADDLAVQAAENLAGIVGYNQQTLLNNATQQYKNYDIADAQNAALRALTNRQARREAGNDWQTEQQNLQSTLRQLLDAGGNAKNGSWIYNLWDVIARVDDMADAETLNTLRQNINTNDNNYWEALMSTNNSRNDLATDTESDLRELASDYVAQLNNLLTKNIMDTSEEGSEHENKNFTEGLFDTENHTINIPEWLTTDYYNSNTKEAVVPDEVALTRSANAAQAANSLAGLTSANISQSTNNNYWARLRDGYSRRTQ